MKHIVYHGTGLGELYDLEADPGELHNLAGAPDHADVAAAFAAEVAEWWDGDAIRAEVLASQRMRRAVHAGMSAGRDHPVEGHPQLGRGACEQVVIHVGHDAQLVPLPEPTEGGDGVRKRRPFADGPRELDTLGF